MKQKALSRASLTYKITLNISGGGPDGIFFIPHVCSYWCVLFCTFSKWLQVRMESLSFWNCWDSHGTWPKDINKNENKHSEHTLLFGKSKGNFSGEPQPSSLHKTCLGKPVRLICYLVTRHGNSVSAPQKHVGNKVLLLDSQTFTPVLYLDSLSSSVYPHINMQAGKGKRIKLMHKHKD